MPTKRAVVKKGEPTLAEYIEAAIGLATLVRKALDHHGSVPRKDLERAVVRFEQLDFRAL